MPLVHLASVEVGEVIWSRGRRSYRAVNPLGFAEIYQQVLHSFKPRGICIYLDNSIISPPSLHRHNILAPLPPQFTCMKMQAKLRPAHLVSPCLPLSSQLLNFVPSTTTTAAAASHVDTKHVNLAQNVPQQPRTLIPRGINS